MLTSDNNALRLAGLRLRTLVSQHTVSENKSIKTESILEVSEFGTAVGAVDGDTSWVLLTARHEFGLGPAMIWALRNKAIVLKLFTEHNAGDLARRAGCFNFKIEVFEITNNAVAVSVPIPVPVPVPVPVSASGSNVRPTPALPCAVPVKEISSADESFVDFICSGGAEITREHGVLAGEVCGLEVCRVVHETSDPAFVDSHVNSLVDSLVDSRPDSLVDSRLEIGVGTHDRETFQMLHGRTATIESLRKVVDEVVAKRVIGANPHPLNQLGRERLLRHLICASPNLVDAVSLQTVAPPMPRANLKDQVPCCASGVSSDGKNLVVIFSIGIDPDVISFGADARLAIDTKADLVFVSPQRDIVPAIVQLAELLNTPARFVGCNLLDTPTRHQN